MTMFQVYALAAPLNAFIWCAFITFFLKNFHFKNNTRMIVTYVIYLLVSFAQCAGGNGIFNLDMEVFNLMQFIMFACAGACVCTGVYFFYERGNISRKLEAKREAKGK